jgi:probable rRNA maturation factor
VHNIVIENDTGYDIDLELLESISRNVSNQEIELIITTNEEIHEINLTTRGIDKPTDVLSFPYEDTNFPEGAPLGSIVISVDYVETKANELNHTFNEELALLFIHGLLHLNGYDHETDNGEHRIEEERLIKQFNLPDSLIVRNS